MGVDLCIRDSCVSEEFLNYSQVGAVFNQTGCKTMPKNVRSYFFGKFYSFYYFVYGFSDGFILKPKTCTVNKQRGIFRNFSYIIAWCEKLPCCVNILS